MPGLYLMVSRLHARALPQPFPPHPETLDRSPGVGQSIMIDKNVL